MNRGRSRWDGTSQFQETSERQMRRKTQESGGASRPRRLDFEALEKPYEAEYKAWRKKICFVATCIDLEDSNKADFLIPDSRWTPKITKKSNNDAAVDQLSH